MARATTVWEIAKGSSEPQKLPEGNIDVEKTLETWVEKHPDLLEPGLVVLARQLETAGGPLDLLCLDADARLVVVELKRDNAYRVALAQVLDYTACLASLSYDDFRQAIDENRDKRGESERLEEVLQRVLEEDAPNWTPEREGEPRVMLVGTGADASLRRIVDYLTTRYDMPINGVFFDVSQSASGSTILVRSAVVADAQASQQGRPRGRGGMTHAELLAVATELGVDAFVQPVLTAWTTATGRSGRPERKEKCWSLAMKSAGRTPAAYLYPQYAGEADKTGWLWIVTEKLAADLHLDEAALVESMNSAGVQIDEDGWIELGDPKATEATAKWITTAYANGATNMSTPVP